MNALNKFKTIDLLPAVGSFSHTQNKQLGLVVHYISNKYANKTHPFVISEVVDILEKYKYSYHTLIDRSGTQYNLVPEKYKAYHAGLSIMNGLENCNDFCLGVALLSTGGNILIDGKLNTAYTTDQLKSFISYAAKLYVDYGVSSHWMRGHSNVRAAWREKYPNLIKTKGSKATKKYDPGDQFPWQFIGNSVTQLLKESGVIIG